MKLNAKRKYSSSDFTGIYYAHRGLHDNRQGVPENSLAAFRAATEKGYGVELDVQLSSDGQVVVFHDGAVHRMCGVEGKVADFSLSELQQMRLLDTEETIPLFTDVLDVLREGAGPLIVELKAGDRNDELCQKTLDILQDYPRIFCIESFDPNIVLWFCKHAPEVFRGQLSQPQEDYGTTVAPMTARLLAECGYSTMNQPDFIAYKIGPRPECVLRMRKKGVLLIGWTSHDAEKDAKDNDGVIFESCTPPLRYEVLS